MWRALINLESPKPSSDNCLAVEEREGHLLHSGPQAQAFTGEIWAREGASGGDVN